MPIEFGGALNAVDAAIAKASQDLVTATNTCLGDLGAEPVRAHPRDGGPQARRRRNRPRVVTVVNATVRVSYGESGTATFRDHRLWRESVAARSARAANGVADRG